MRVPEWLNGTVCKTVEIILIVGSNPSPHTMKGKIKPMPKEDEQHINPERKESEIEQWLAMVESESLLPMVNREVLEKTLQFCLEKDVSPRFVMTLCPVFENIENAEEGQPTRRVLPFSKDIPRLRAFAREAASFIVGTEKLVGIKPELLLIINDIFEPGAEERIEGIGNSSQALTRGKRELHTMFQDVDSRNEKIWPHCFQKSVKIIRQSDFVKPLKRIDLPPHEEIVQTLMRETLDPNLDAFKAWLHFMKNTRNDPLMSPNAWLTESGAKTIHERVRFLTAMYWTDGIVNPLLFKTVFIPKKGDGRNLVPIFISGVTRELQAEMEMAGVNLKLGESSINKHPRISGVCQPTPVIHVFKNTAMWTEDAQTPFSCGGVCVLK